MTKLPEERVSSDRSPPIRSTPRLPTESVSASAGPPIVSPPVIVQLQTGTGQDCVPAALTVTKLDASEATTVSRASDQDQVRWGDSLPWAKRLETASGRVGPEPLAAKPRPILLPVGTLPVAEDESDTNRSSAAVVAPPWLISLMCHLVGMIALGLLFLPQILRPPIELEMEFAEELGEQLFQDVQIAALDPNDAEEQLVAPVDLPLVANPLAAPQDLEIVTTGTLATSDFSVSEIGLALTGRTEGMKPALLAAYGGTALTEAAVEAGLQWLKRNQKRDGGWSLMGPFGDESDRAVFENRLAATAMALLAFQGAGNTTRVGKYAEQVRSGWKYLLPKQDRDGGFTRGARGHHMLYTHGQCMIALCELYGMTKDSQYRSAAQNAVDYAVKTQDRLGGWRYRPGSESDTSVTGWFVMGLQSARMATLEVPRETLDKVSAYLDAAATYDGERYGYQPGNVETPSMTAEALLCRQYLGWNHEDRRLVNGVRYLTGHPIDPRNRDVYYWYYATQVFHHMEGQTWNDWNRVMRQYIPESQVKRGRERGSWSPIGDRWGNHGGRLYTTCLSIYMLEVYYRHLPIYAHRPN